MNTTIAVLQDVQGNMRVDIQKCGRKYLVGIYDNTSTSYNYQIYETKRKANDAFNRLADAIISGCYTYSERVEMLQ